MRVLIKCKNRPFIIAALVIEVIPDVFPLRFIGIVVVSRGFINIVDKRSPCINAALYTESGHNNFLPG